MSKPFPAIRFHGNNLACARHIKRGMLELFKTEELQKKMGVPVLRRSIEVSEYTTIMIHIAKEQTFIHITSNPPELPEKLPPPPPEKEIDYFLCPYSFLIRKRDRDVKNQIPSTHEADGYLIAYDNTNKTWRIGAFKGKDGSTVPYAANLGWFHAGTDFNYGYNHCDVVTWHGQSAPDFTGPHMGVLTGQTYGTWIGPYIYLKKVFYFQGRKLSAPDYVQGACILEDEQQKYFYVHTTSYSPYEWGYGTIQSYKCTDRIYRKPYATVMAGTEGDWELLYTLRYENSGLPLKSTHPDGDYFYAWYPPRSCDFIDKDGIAHFIREYTSDNLTQGFETRLNYGYVMEGCNAYFTWNMRTGKVTIKQFFGDVANQSTASEDHVFQEYTTWTNVVLPNVEPWIFYIWPGTEELYYAAYEMEGTGYTDYTRTEFPGQNPSVVENETGVWDAQIKMQLYKNDKPKSVIADYFYIGSQRKHREAYAGQQAYSGNLFSRAYHSKILLEYHPDIPKCERSWIKNVDLDVATVHFVDVYKGVNTLVYSEMYPQTIAIEDSTTHVPVGYVAFGVPWHSNLLINETEERVRYDLTLYSTRGSRADYDLMCDVNIVGNGLTMIDLQSPMDGQYPVCGGISAATCIGLGQPIHNYSDWNNAMYGSAGTVQRISIYADGESSTHFKPDSYAVHRRPPGMSEKPYIYLRQKVTPALHPETGYPLSPEAHIDLFGSTPKARYVQSEDGVLIKGATYTYTPDYYLYSKPCGPMKDIEDVQNPEVLLDTREWELLTNVLSAEVLNKLTKETGNAFFDIGIL